MLQKKLFFISYFIVFTAFVTQSQNKTIDEIIENKIVFYKGINNDSLLYYSKKLQESKNSCSKYSGKICEALSYYNIRDFDKSEKIITEILNELKLEKEFCLKKIKIESYNRLFWIKKNQCKYQEAFETLLSIKEIVNSIPTDKPYYNTINLSIKMNMSLIKSILGHHKEARKILNGILKSYYIQEFNVDKNHDQYSKTLNKTSVLNLIGDSFLNSSKSKSSIDLDSASFYFKKAYEVAKNFTPPHKDSETLYNLREAEVLIAKHKFKEALSVIQKNNKNAKEFNTEQNISYLKAICFNKLEVKDSAVFYSKLFLSLLKTKSSLKKRTTVINDILANQFFKDKQLDSAYKYSELTLSGINDLNNSKSEVNVSHYLYDFKNVEKLNNEISKKNKKSSKILISITGIIIALALFIIYFFYKKNKNTSVKFNKVNNQLKSIPTTQKKEYNLDAKLEKDILNGLEDLENSTYFLAPSFNINILAKKLNTNTSYLSYTINKEFGKTFKQYITQLRIEYLIKKLKEDNKLKNYTIKSLAEEIGYTNASAFARAFKKYKGISPSDFLKSIDKKD